MPRRNYVRNGRPEESSLLRNACFGGLVEIGQDVALGALHLGRVIVRMPGPPPRPELVELVGDDVAPRAQQRGDRVVERALRRVLVEHEAALALRDAEPPAGEDLGA